MVGRPPLGFRVNMASPRPSLSFFTMHILYVDESGNPADSKQKYFVLAGVSVFERQIYWLDKDIREVAARFDSADPDRVELHGSPMVSGKKFWRRFPRAKREEAIIDTLKILANSPPANRIFASVVESDAIDSDPMVYAFSQVASRFDQYLQRLHRESNDSQRGMLLFDKSVHEHALQSLTAHYRDRGHQWGQLRNFVEVPAFIDSRASRLIQLADLVAFSIYRKYHGDDRFFRVIESRFDSYAGRQHGLHVTTRKT